MITKIFGTGGIGTGVLFKFSSDRPLTRDESRPARLTDCKDYCKGHIILHYAAALTGGVRVYAIGIVGDDEHGARLISEMTDAGVDARFVAKTREARTMYSVCFQYPDGAGGNITASNSASALVTPGYIEECAGRPPFIDGDSIVVSAPEVPVRSRIRLLEIGRRAGAYNVSSFLAEEAYEFMASGGIELSELISINRGEALALTGGEAGSDDAQKTASAAAEIIFKINPFAALIVTAGADGSFVCEAGRVTKIPRYGTDIVSTAGAGDAYLGGTIAGLASGLGLVDSARYGAAAAGVAVTSEHTIAAEVTAENIKKFFGKDLT